MLCITVQTCLISHRVVNLCLGLSDVAGEIHVNVVSDCLCSARKS